jgi:heptose I phosphotransferase
MQPFYWIHPDYSELVERHRLADLSATLAREDGIPCDSPSSNSAVWLTLADTNGQDHRLLLLREVHVRWREAAWNYAIHGAWASAARMQWLSLHAIRSAGVSTATPVACVEEQGWPLRACLTVCVTPSAKTLDHLLDTQHAVMKSGQREHLFRSVGALLAEVHRASFRLPRLAAGHVLVDGPVDAPEIGLAQAVHCHPVATMSVRKRAADLGTLLASFLPRWADSRDRQWLLDGYVELAGLFDVSQELVARTGRLSRRQTHEKRDLLSSPVTFPVTLPRLEVLDAGRMWVDARFRPWLERAGLTSVDSMMSTQDGKLLRALRDRENWRLELNDGHHQPRGAYLKKHHFSTVGTWMRAKLGTGPGISPGRAEARSVAKLAQGGIAAMQLIAFGEQLHKSGKLESFVLTEELNGFTQLDHFLRRRFAPLAVREPQRDEALDDLIVSVADVAARFHRLGFNHRDLYCCHFFIREDVPAQFQVHLIDLQRVEHRRRLRGRWIVKDLAQLAYSAPRDRLTCTDRMRFMKRYLGVNRLQPEHKLLIRRVLGKQRRMERSLGPHP